MASPFAIHHIVRRTLCLCDARETVRCKMTDWRFLSIFFVACRFDFCICFQFMFYNCTQLKAFSRSVRPSFSITAHAHESRYTVDHWNSFVLWADCGCGDGVCPKLESRLFIHCKWCALENVSNAHKSAGARAANRWRENIVILSIWHVKYVNIFMRLIE